MGIRKRIRVRYTKLGREQSWGMAHYDDNTIEIDERLRGKKHLEIMLHEATHILLPMAKEEEVERISINLTNILWKDGYRKFDNNNDLPMQDGKK